MVSSAVSPGPLPSEPVDLPESLGYRLKNILLGPPLNTSQLRTERLSNPVALGVLAPDCISSSAYGTEEILRVLVPVVGVAAFTLVLPITAAIIGVLVFVTLSYREVVQVYTRAGGSYVVARDNFGPNIAQISAVALLIDYTVTVAVQTAAGTAALVSAVPALTHYQVLISVLVVVVLCYGNLRGIREAGKTFAFPTYFFSAFLLVVIIIGLVRVATGTLPQLPVHVAGAVHLGHVGTGIFAGAGLFYILQAYANGGSALTGLEAISNGVSAFRPPEGVNARKVLVVMSTTLGVLVMGVSVLAHFTHAVPYVSGAPTVIAQEAKLIFGGGLGRIPYYLFQLASLLILWTGANTSFNGFPFLASFVAEDQFLPRQLTKRGHRLVFSNGILVLAVVAIALLIATRSSVDFLISFYAIGVFTGFTMAGAGMVKHHLDHREPGWRVKMAINGSAACVSGAVVLIFASTKFLEGAWVVVVAFPLLLWLLVRLNRQYRRERERLERGAERAAEARALRRHVVLVFVDRLDMATARALQYARTIDPEELRAVHFVLDDMVSEHLRQQWERLGLPQKVTLDLRNCPSRRLVHDAVQLVAEELVDGNTEVSVLLPRRAYARGWSRILHDRTADRIAGQVSRLPHANATIVPFQVEAEPLLVRRQPERAKVTKRAKGTAEHGRPAPLHVEGTVPIGEVRWRQRAKVAGWVQAVEVQPWGDTPRLTATVIDETGGLTLVFGRRDVAGLTTGACLVAEGTVSEARGRLAMFNPLVTLLPPDGEGTGQRA